MGTSALVILVARSILGPSGTCGAAFRVKRKAAATLLGTFEESRPNHSIGRVRAAPALEGF
jgi:hypothetical protein